MGLGSYNRLKISGSVFVFTLVVILAHLNVGSSLDINRKLAIQFISYENKIGALLNGSCCDGLGQPGQCQRDACDSAFDICIGRTFNNTCDTTVMTTALENNNTVLSFGKTLDPLDANSTQSLIVLPVPFDISETLLFDVTVREVDPHIANKTLTTANSAIIGNFTRQLTPTHDVFSPHPNWNTFIFDDNVVRLVMNVTTFCGNHWYGENCDVECRTTNNNAQGHFDCDPKTGGKVCKNGYENPSGSCKTMTDMCVSSPCQNNASCSTIVAGDFNCACGSDYAGKECESETTGACASTPCLNGGACKTVGQNDFACRCLPGFEGNTCATKTACFSAPCQNGGTCSPVGTDDFTCACTADFQGKTCDSSLVGLCRTSPCKHDGACRPLTNDFACKCSVNYTGKVCESSLVGACHSSPCQNSGICEPTPSGNFTCTCTAGFTGSVCETAYTPNSSANADDGGMNIGVVLGPLAGLLALGALGLLFFLLYRRRKKREVEPDEEQNEEEEEEEGKEKQNGGPKEPKKADWNPQAPPASTKPPTGPPPSVTDW